MMQQLKSVSLRNLETEREDAKFQESLRELRDLHSQLHQAADYCETTFLHAQERRIAVDNTKEYICRALVTVIDHLGCVSSKLNCAISKTQNFSNAELRINSLNQRLLSCEEYVHKLAFRRSRWNVNPPQYHCRYLSSHLCKYQLKQLSWAATASIEKLQGPVSAPASPQVINKHGFNSEDLPLFLYTYTPKPPLLRLPSNKHQSPKTPSNSVDDSSSVIVCPARDGCSPSKNLSPTFHFQQKTHKHGKYTIIRRSLHSNDILSLIRRNKRVTL